MNNTPVNPMFAKFDAVLGKTTPTTTSSPVSTRADEIRNLAKQAQTTQQESQTNQQFGSSPKLSNAPREYVQGVAGRAMNDIKQAGGDYRDAIMGEGKYAGDNFVTRGFEAAGAAFGAIPKVASEVIPQGVKDAAGKVYDSTVGAGVKNVADTISNSKTVQDFTQNHPTATNAIEQGAKIGESSGTIAGTVLGAEGAAKLAQGGANLMSKSEGAPIAETMNKPTMPVSSPEDKLLSSASKRVTPDYESMTPNQQSKLAAETSANGQPRVTEGGIKGRVVNQTSSEIAASKELSKVPGYSDKLSNLETHNLIKDAIKTEAKSLRSDLASQKISIPKKEILSTVSKAVSTASEDSLLLSKSDPIIENYLRVASKAAQGSSGNVEGILDTRQALDDAYYNSRGKMAYGDTRINSLDEIHQSARDSLNKMLEKYAPNSKESLAKQTNLYRADDNILPKVGKESSTALGRTKIMQTIKKHPYITGAVTGGVADKVLKTTTGFGI